MQHHSYTTSVSEFSAILSGDSLERKCKSRDTVYLEKCSSIRFDMLFLSDTEVCRLH